MGGVLAGHRRLIWIGIAAVVAVVVWALTAGGPPEKTTATETVTVDRGPVTTEVATTGTVRPAQTRSLSFSVEGTVATVEVRPGTTVTPGQELATVDDTDAAVKADDARTALAEAQDALDESKAAAAITPSSCPSYSKEPCGRTGNGGDAILTAEQRVTQARTALLEAEEALEGTSITAPFAGRVLTVGGKVGTQVGGGATFITLADVHDMQISANFPEADAVHLKNGQTAQVTLADRAGQTFAATVVQVDPAGVSDGTLTRFGVLLAFTETPDDLLVGQSAAVRITIGRS